MENQARVRELVSKTTEGETCHRQLSQSSMGPAGLLISIGHS